MIYSEMRDPYECPHCGDVRHTRESKVARCATCRIKLLDHDPYIYWTYLKPRIREMVRFQDPPARRVP